MLLLRRLVLIWLAAIMVLTSGSMALSRAAPDGQIIVICSGTDVSTIRVDFQGNQIDPLPVCPDCLILKAMLSSPAPIVHAPDTFTLIHRAAILPSHTDTFRIHAQARGPPASL